MFDLASKLGFRRPQKRHDPKTRCIEFCPAWLDDSTEDSARMYMIDLSVHGARFRNPAPNPRVKVHANQEVGFTIKTPYGRSHATGKISWVTPDETGETFGVEFTHLSEQKDDPLRLLMDSPLC